MTKPVILRLSARDEIMWHFHVVLDQMVEGPDGRGEFVRRILRDFGVSRFGLAKLVARVCERLPTDLHSAEMPDVLRAFETAVPVEWRDDLVNVDVARVATLRKTLVRVLSERDPSMLPKALTARILVSAEDALELKFDAKGLPDLSESIVNTLVNELWRSRDPESLERLVDRLMYSIRAKAKLRFPSAE